jgi:hypothetical protein
MHTELPTISLKFILALIAERMDFRNNYIHTLVFVGQSFVMSLSLK